MMRRSRECEPGLGDSDEVDAVDASMLYEPNESDWQHSTSSMPGCTASESSTGRMHDAMMPLILLPNDENRSLRAAAVVDSSERNVCTGARQRTRG